MTGEIRQVQVWPKKTLKHRLTVYEFWKFKFKMELHQLRYFMSALLNKKCPFWNILDEIFGHKTNIKPVAIFESSRLSESTLNEDGDFILDESVDIEFQVNQNDESVDTPPNAQAGNLKFEQLASGDIDEDSQDNKFAIKRRLQNRVGTSSNNSSAILFEISKQRTEYQERKLELETKKYETQIDLEGFIGRKTHRQ